MAEIFELDGATLADDVRSGRVSAVEAVEASLERIATLDGELNAFCDVAAEAARSAAATIDEQVRRGEDPGPWAGVPMGVKETQPAIGLSFEEGSLLYEGRRADHDAIPIARLRAAGAVFVGATTAPEFGSLNWTRTYLHGVTRNPWNPERTPGGSSGGSAAAVAAGMVPVATGGDGGGSVRIPSAYCGLFGFKVSFGRIPSLDFDSSLTAVHGPLCRSVRDAARYIDVVGGPHPTDPSSLAPVDRPYEAGVRDGTFAALLAGKRVAWSATLGHAACEPEVERVVHDAMLAFVDDAGLELVDVDVDIPRPGGAWAVLSSLDMVRAHERAARGRLDDLTPVVRAGFDMVEGGDLAAVRRALTRRQEILDAVGRLFGEVDLLVTPTTATTALEAKGKPPREIAGQRVGGMGSVPFTAAFNVSGQPAASIPVGAVDGLPVGMQVVARRHEEALLFGAGALVEANRPWPRLATRRGSH